MPVDPRWERVVRVFEETLEGSAAPGGAIGVVLDGKVAFTAARGVRKMGTTLPVTTSTLFRLESVTKTFTALAALSLVEKKELDLDAPVVDIVPSITFTDAAAGRNVTMRRLLAHTAGLPRGLDGKSTGYDDFFSKHPLTLGPVDRFQYSNVGYRVIGAVLERTSKTPIDGLLSARVTTPLGMKTATTDGKIATAREHAEGYGSEGGRDYWFALTYIDSYVQRSVGGLHASIEELALFASRLLVGAPEVLRAETFETMTTKYVETETKGFSYGYGLNLTDSAAGPVWMHTGAGVGSSAYFICAPRQRYAFVASTNSSHFDGFPQIHHAASEAFLGSRLF